MFNTAKASSTYLYIPYYSPRFAIDGKISDIGRHFYHSKREDFPWFQLRIPEGYVSGVEIVARSDCCGNRLKNIEIRAGMTSVPDGFKGQLTVNTKVGFFPGPASNGQTFIISFDKRVLAKYITLQNIGEDVLLEINEVTILKGTEF